MILDKMDNLQQRIIVGGISTICVALAIFLSANVYFQPLFVLIVGVIISVALSEFYYIARVKGFAPLSFGAIILSWIYLFALYLTTQCHCLTVLPSIVFGLSTIVLFLYYFIQGTSPLVNLSLTFFGLLYLTIPLGFIIGIIFFFPSDSAQDGRWWLFYAIAVTKMTDTGAYFFGKKLGKTKLAPSISPKKTVEGAMGGFIFAISTSLIIYLIGNIFFKPPIFDLTFWQSIWLGLLIALAAQFGDLAESLLKRDGGIKDSNHLPGIGGILDLVDSLIFTIPLVYIFMKIQFQL